MKRVQNLTFCGHLVYTHSQKHVSLQALLRVRGCRDLRGLSLQARLDRGEISGFVKDPTSAFISAAGVTIRNEATGISARLVTNERGFYQAPNLVSGYYPVEVEAAGFKKYSEQHVKLDAASMATVNVSLSVGAMTESVSVVASPAQVRADTVGRAGD